jgi:hypothetical protein
MRFWRKKHILAGMHAALQKVAQHFVAKNGASSGHNIFHPLANHQTQTFVERSGQPEL